MINIMAHDLSIPRYLGETEESYIYRVCYSALGLWTLNLANSTIDGKRGISKIAQTNKICELMQSYAECVRLNQCLLTVQQNDFSVFLRNVYEATGYLLSDDRNYSLTVNYGRTIRINNIFLYYGVPDDIVEMNGLGVYSEKGKNESNYYEAFIRDRQSIKDYVNMEYQLTDFNEHDIDFIRDNNILLYDPFLKQPPSKSWTINTRAQFTMGKQGSINCYYKIIQDNSENTVYSSIIEIGNNKNQLNGFEMRRLYCALKAYYCNPVIAWINKIDDNYSEIRLSASLPNREYYFLLLTSWPEKGTGAQGDKHRFIIRNSMIPAVTEVLKNIGLECQFRRGI